MNGEFKNIRLSKCSIGKEERDAVMRVFDNEYFGMGKEVQAFENELKNFMQTDLEVVCVNTGTSALHLAILCLDLHDGDEVLVPSITYVASFQSISATGAIPIACDVLEDSVFIDLKDAEKRLTKKTRAIMPVHYASDCSRIDEVYAFAKKHNLRVVEDAAQSMGSKRNGEYVGKRGDILCFSFDGIKNITCGEGGMLVTSDKELAHRVRDARLLGVERDTEKRFSGERSWVFDVKHQGFRYHMSDIMAAIGRAQLAKIEILSSKRRALVTKYRNDLKDCSTLKLMNFDYDNILPHIFVVRVLEGKRDLFLDQMKKKGVSCGMHYYPNHLLTKYRTSYSLPVAEKLLNEILTLPLHPDLTLGDLDYILSTIKEIDRSLT